MEMPVASQYSGRVRHGKANDDSLDRRNVMHVTRKSEHSRPLLQSVNTVNIMTHAALVPKCR